MTSQTFSIPATRLTKLTARLDKLAKKANKYGTELVSYQVGKTFYFEKSKGVEIEMVDITVSGEAPKYGDHTFAAKVELLGEENLVHNIADIKLDPRFRTMVNECDHCGYNRVRNDVFVFVDNNTGEQLAVGRTCLRDFTGCDNPQEITARASWIEDVKKACQDEEENFYSGGGEYFFRTEYILERAAANIRTHGWSPKSKEDYQLGVISTASMVELDLFPSAKHTPVEVTEQDKLIVEETIKYFKNASFFDSEYLDNIRVILKKDHVSRRHLGLAVSSINHILREKTKQAEMAEKGANSDFVGTVKQRGKGIELKFTKEIYLGSGPYGDKYLYTFVEGEGNQIAWFTSKQDFKIGKIYSMDFTVKEHKEYNGVKQTVITRAKVK